VPKAKYAGIPNEYCNSNVVVPLIMTGTISAEVIINPIALSTFIVIMTSVQNAIAVFLI
jgi:hypothetical protein